MRYRYGQSRGRLSPLLLSALALVVGALGACGSSDSGWLVELEAAESSGCPIKWDAGARAAPGVGWDRCDLTGAYLSDSNLSNAYLTDSNLSNADLSGANLSNADLSGAELRGANLKRR